MTDDIVTRLRDYDFMRDGDFPELTMAEAADEIERLREQATKAHAILGSELFIWFFLSSKYRKSRREQLLPYLGDYWDKYGNAFKEVRRG